MLLSRLRALRQTPAAADWRVLFIDDGSNDTTFARLLRAESDAPWMEVVRHRENVGLGAALRTGFAHTRSPIVCTMDADCTYPPERLPELVALIARGADIATASAWHPDSEAANVSALRAVMSSSVSRLYKLLLSQDVYTFTCLFRAYSRAVIDDLRFHGNGFAAVAELMLKAIDAGYRIAEVPMRLEPRQFGTSKLKMVDAVAAHASLLLMTATMVATSRVRRLSRRQPVR